jgi:hypothetical protein
MDAIAGISVCNLAMLHPLIYTNMNFNLRREVIVLISNALNLLKIKTIRESTIQN